MVVLSVNSEKNICKIAKCSVQVNFRALLDYIDNRGTLLTPLPPLDSLQMQLHPIKISFVISFLSKLLDRCTAADNVS